MSTLSTDGWPPGERLPEPPEDFVDRYWASLSPHVANEHTSVTEADQAIKEMQTKEAEASRREAEEAKAKFTKILETWDAEHDKEQSTGKKRKWGNESIVAQVRANISQMHSWEDVFAALREAENHYNNSSKLRKFFRKGASKSEAIEPFVELIPGGDYTSVICAGIQFILKACSAANRSRDEIVSLVEMLPEKVEIAKQYADLYSSEPSLQAATSQLYSKILSAMEAIISFWNKDRSFEFLKPLLYHNMYKPLEQELEDVKKASEHVQRTIQVCDRNRLAHIASGVERTEETIQEFKSMLVQYFNAQWQATKWLIMKNQQMVPPPMGPQASITPKEILDTLTNSSASSGKSLPNRTLYQDSFNHVLQVGYSMEKQAKDRAAWLMSETKIQRWFRSRHSRALVINGNCTLQRISPLSFFCAVMIESLHNVEPVIVLHHFCGLSTFMNPADEGLSGSALLIRALLHQIAAQWRFGELTCLSQDDAQALQGSDPNLTPDFLLSVFQKLVLALPRGQPVFLIIDGVNYYEIREFCRETKHMLKKLVNLLKAEASVKLIVTGTSRILEVNQYFEDDEKVFIPATPAAKLTGLSKKQMDASVSVPFH
ncbi:hypothetical protein BDV19DRAFT_389434 [Aspergillus venezuelensis]